MEQLIRGICMATDLSGYWLNITKIDASKLNACLQALYLKNAGIFITISALRYLRDQRRHIDSATIAMMSSGDQEFITSDASYEPVWAAKYHRAIHGEL